MAQRGRPPLPRGIKSFENSDWAAPEAILLDTTVVVEALLPAEKNHAACVSFFQSAAEAECTLVFNRLLETELCDVLFNLAGQEQHGNKWRKVRYDGRVRRRASRLLKEGLQAWGELLDTVPWSGVARERGHDPHDSTESDQHAHLARWSLISIRSLRNRAKQPLPYCR